MSIKPVSFLVVDDDIVCIMSLKRMISKLDMPNPVHVAGDGREALELLRRVNQKDSIQSPFLVILDLNMPRMSGHEFIKQVRADKDLSDIVIFVMSSSNAPQDIQEAYDAHVAGYIVKNGAPNNIRDALGFLDSYTQLVEMPQTPAQYH